METFDIIQSARFMMTVFKSVGLWRTQISWTLRDRLHSIFVQIPFSVAYVLFMCINLAFIDDVKTSTESLYMTLTELAMLAKSFTLVRKHEKIVVLLRQMQSSLLMPRSESELKVYKGLYRNFNMQRTVFVGISLSCIVSGYVAAGFSNRMKLPFPAWMPIDWKSSSVNYCIAFAYEVLAMTLTTMINASCDLFMAYILFQISVFFRVLSSRVQAIGQANNWERERGGRPVEELLECVEIHQYLTSMTKDAEEILTGPLFFQMNISGIVICFSAFQLTLLSPIKEFGAFLLYFYYMGAMIIEILLPCYYGNEIIVESGLILTSIYTSNWTDMPMQYKKLMYHFMERLKKSSIVLVGGFFILNLKALVSVIKSAYSLFALIINLEK